MRLSLSRQGPIRTPCTSGDLFAIRAKHVIPKHRVRSDNGRTTATSVIEPSERWLSFWSTIDATAWLGTVAAGVGLLVTQEAMLLALPLILPLVALYANRERGQLERRGIQAMLQNQINSTLKQVACTNEKASSELAEEILSILEDFAEDMASSKDSVSLDKKISALEGALASSTSSVINAVTEAAGENGGQLKELSSLMKVLRNELAAISRQSGRENIEFLDHRLSKLEGSVAGLKDAQTDSMKLHISQITSLLDGKTEMQLNLNKEFVQLLNVLRQDILERFDESEESDATKEEYFEKALGDQSELILELLKVQERTIVEAMETKMAAYSSSPLGGNLDMDGEIDKFKALLEASSTNTSMLGQELASIREENAKLSSILHQSMEFQKRASQGTMDASNVYVIMQTIIKQLEMLRQDIHHAFRSFNTTGNVEEITKVQDLERKVDNSISNVLGELTRMSTEPYITDEDKKNVSTSENYGLIKNLVGFDYAELNDKLTKILVELEVLRKIKPKEYLEGRETDLNVIDNGDNGDLDNHNLPRNNLESPGKRIEQPVLEDASAPSTKEISGLPKFSDFVQSGGSEDASPEIVVQPLEITSGGIPQIETLSEEKSIDYIVVPDVADDSDETTVESDAVGDGGIDSAIDEDKYIEALRSLREGRSLADSEDSLRSLIIAKELLEKSAIMLDTMASVHANDVKVLGNCGNALLALGRVNLQIYEKQLASFADGLDSKEPDPVFERDAEKLLIMAGRRYLKVLELDPSQGRAFFNWGRAIHLRGELATLQGKLEQGCALFANAAEKFEAAFQSGFEDGEAYYLAGSSLLSAAGRGTCSVEENYQILEVAESFLASSIKNGFRGDAIAKQRECLRFMNR